MKTEVIVKRGILGAEISQKSKSEFFSATDLVKVGNKWRGDNGHPPFNDKKWFKQTNVVEFMAALEAKYDMPVRLAKRGRGQHTWVHPLLFIDLALAISPELKIEVYEWLFDHLILFRNDSGDSYKAMAGWLYANHANKAKFPKYIAGVAQRVQKACKVRDWNSATEKQLKHRDEIHKFIALIASNTRDNETAVRVGLAGVLTSD